MFQCTGHCLSCGKCQIIRRMEGESAEDRKASVLVFPEDFVPDSGGEGYALAFDIGTTTVVGLLWDLERGLLLESASDVNPQTRYGQDVIARIAFSLEEGKLEILHKEIIDCLNGIIGRLCSYEHYEHDEHDKDQEGQQEVSPDAAQDKRPARRHAVDPRKILRVLVCGNTTMSHLFLGAPVDGLARAPFQPAFQGPVFPSAGDCGLHVNKDCDLMVVPGIGSHVGGDVTAGILAARLMDKKGTNLYIDIGTNGEIVLFCDGEVYACSTAAGPAFEGASIYQGMRAAEGAIERVYFQNNEILYQVIGHVPPVGICGSGLIDAVAQMLSYGIIDESGRMAAGDRFLNGDLKAESAGEHAVSGDSLKEYLVEDQDGRKMILAARTGAEDIVITQKDIRQVQLAKAAIAAGISLLLQRAGKCVEDLDGVYLAGAFGNYINKESAVRIGLLPDIVLSKIHALGNAAGTGALMAAASREETAKVLQIPAGIQHVELAAEEGFQEEYIGAMGFRCPAHPKQLERKQQKGNSRKQK